MKIAMDDHGIVYHATQWEKDADGNPLPKWVPMVIVNFEQFSKDFRRPEW
jgi:hypothetical protein